MERAWYKVARNCLSLRKNTLRVDMGVYVDPEETFADRNYLVSTVKSILTAAIINGLDIIGILSSNKPDVGLMARNMAIKQQMDIVVIPGQTYKCREGEDLYIYKLTESVPLNLLLTEACKFAHDRNGFVIITNVGKRQNQSLTKLYGSANLPDAVEIFNFKAGGFRDLPVRLPEFISSGATSAQEIEGIKTFTLLDRKDAVDFGLIEEETGVDYVPKYLRPNKGRY
jgi:hypothetical protein